MLHKKHIFLLTIVFLFFFILNITSLTSCQEKKNTTQKLSSNDYDSSKFKSVIPILLDKGASQKFINKYLKDTSTNVKFNEMYTKINVTGYLKRADYSYVYGEKAVKAASDFIEKYSTVFDSVEIKYNVSRETIAAILWTETRIGNYLGTHNIANVYFSTALANQPEYVEINMMTIDTMKISVDEKKKFHQQILQRSERKHKWAINELVAMSKIEENYNIDFSKIDGSWAGAFGWCQFLPSSFLKTAIDGNEDNKIDLFNPEDAIYSIANYLKSAGWDKNSVKKQRSSLFNYNNSSDYVDAILKLCNVLHINKNNHMKNN